MKSNGHVMTTEKPVKRLKPVRDFGEQTSFHGLKYVTERQSFPARRLFWLILFLTCLGALVFQIVDRIIYYYDSPTTVNVGVNYNKTLQFPAITICNQNAFKATLATRHGWYEMIEEMFSSRAENNSIKDFVNLTLDDMYLNTAHQKKDFIFSCSWKGTPCAAEDFRQVLTDHGVCFTWNGHDGHVSSPGVENGLKLHLNVEQYEYMPGPHDAAGVKILIHDSFEIPRVYALGQAVSTGSNIFAGVQLLKVNNLPKPHGFCSINKLKYVDVYTQGGCKLDCLSKTAAGICGCRHIYMPSKNGYPPVCTIGQYYSCLKELIDTFPILYEDKCECPVPCEFNAYESDISYASTSRVSSDRFLHLNETQNLQDNLKTANEVTSRMDKNKLSQFRLYYHDFKSKLLKLEEKFSNDFFQSLETFNVSFSKVSNYVHHVCSWKNWLYGYQEYVVAKNFIRPRDAYEERNFHIIALGYNEFILEIENNIRSLNSTSFGHDSVRSFLYYLTVSSLNNRQEIIKRSLVNFSELITAYQEGVGIFNYTYDFAPKSHNDYAVPAPLLLDSLSHNNYARKHSVRFESYLNRTIDVLSNLKDLTDNVYDYHNLTEEAIFKSREDFRWLMRNWMYARAVTYYEVIERPLRILQDRHAEFEKQCSSAQKLLSSIEDQLHSLFSTVLIVNSSYFNHLHTISQKIDNYFVNSSGSKYSIAESFMSTEMKNGRLNLSNLLQLILKDDSELTTELDQVKDLHIDIFNTILSDEDAFVYYNFSGNFDFLRPVDVVEEEITSNYTYLNSLVRLYETVGTDGEAFLGAMDNLNDYLASYLKSKEIDNNFIRENFLQLDIFYKQMSYEEITQQKAYDLFALICDIGGSMGLFLGASLLSVCELFDLLFTNLMMPRRL